MGTENHEWCKAILVIKSESRSDSQVI